MILFSITLFSSIFLLSIGLFLLLKKELFISFIQNQLRCRLNAIFLFGGGLVWFLLNILSLSELNFGSHKDLLFIFFLFLGLSSFFLIPDFLAVRGFSVLILLLARPLLDLAFLERSKSRLFFIIYIYCNIIIALYLAIFPYKLRDLLIFLRNKSIWTTILAFFCLFYGSILVIVSFNY